MDRREFLGLVAKVAGAVVLMPYIEFPKQLYRHHPDGDRKHFIDSILAGTFNAHDIACYLETNKGTVKVPVKVTSVVRLERGLDIKFERFECVDSFTVIGFTFVNQLGYVIAQMPPIADRHCEPGDSLIISYELCIT